MQKNMSNTYIAILLVTTTMLFGCSKPEDATIASDVAKIRQIKEKEVLDKDSTNKSHKSFGEGLKDGAAKPIKEYKF